MRRMDLQKHAIMLVGQLSTEELKDVIVFLTELKNESSGGELSVKMDPTVPLGTAIHNLFKPFGGVELNLPSRELMRELPNFDTECTKP